VRLALAQEAAGVKAGASHHQKFLRAPRNLKQTTCNNRNVISEMCVDDYRKVSGIAMYKERVEEK
jgi:hypothetical protein